MSDPETRVEYAQPILERHEAAASEADIRSAVRDFLIHTGLAPESEIQQEEAPAPGESGRVDLRTRDVIFEFKRSIGNGIVPHTDYVTQLDDYLKSAVDGGQPQRFGILTDGKYWVLRWPGMGAVSTTSPNAFTLANAELGARLYDWLRDQSQALEERGVAPSEEAVRSRLGEGPRFESHIAALTELYQANRDDPTIALKRDLWRSLLAAALGQVVEEEPDLDRLFVRHTYLSVVVGLAVQAAFGIGIEAAANSDPVALLGGQLFVDQTGVSGVVESDFFTWPAEEGPAEVGGDEWIRDLAKRIGWFNWNEAESDIARILYESVIPADDRRRLGEYYTPDWLAREIVDAVVTDPLNQRVLDPACGSGSFIFAAVRKYLSAAQDAGRSSAQAVGGLLDHVIGIDVHPVAVHLARATWTLAARDALHAARDAGESVDVTVPVYLGDSLQLRTDAGDLFGRDRVTIRVEGGLDTSLEQSYLLEFPRALVDQADWFDSLISSITSHIDQDQDPVWAIDEDGSIEGSEREMLIRTARTLQRLHREGRDHIWAYYTKNLVRPVALRSEPVDVIVGNPPWINYNQTESILREELRSQSQNRFNIWVGKQFATQQDVSGLFFARCVEVYLKPGGSAAMIMPHSALQAGQFMKWRTGAWGVVNVSLELRVPWDLERIEPNTFFPIAASVAFARRTDESAKRLPYRAHRLRGKEGGPFEIEEISLAASEGEFASPYGGTARNGATVFPRLLFFVQQENPTATVLASDSLTVSPRRSVYEKAPWRDLDPAALISRPIEKAHVFDILLGETLAPYVVLDPLNAAIPLSRASKRLEKLDDGWYGVDPRSLGRLMRGRWKDVNTLWDAHKTAKSRLSLLEQLDYMNKLSVQRGPHGDEGSVRVVYASSGRPTAAILRDVEAVVENTLYWMPIMSEIEAHYVVAIVNSDVLEELVIPITPKNWAGKVRHTHKHLWRIPIPKFDSTKALHREIAEAGAATEKGAVEAWRECRSVRERDGKSTEWRAARADIRKWLSTSDEGRRVEELVGLLLR